MKKIIIIQRIDHIVLLTTKIKEMIFFYCEILGCQIEREQPKIKLIQLRAGDSLIDLVEQNHLINQNQKNMEHFCLNIKDFDYEMLKLYLANFNITPERYGTRYGATGLSYSCYIKDPEGNEVELRDPSSVKNS